MKNKKWNYVIAFFYLALSSYSYAIDYKVLTTEKPPYVTNNNGKPEGIAVEIVDEMFKRSKLKHTIIFNPLARALQEAKKQVGTCAMPISRSQDREYDYLWVSPLLVTQSAAFVAKGSKLSLTVLKEVLAKQIGAQRGSDESEYLKGFGGKIQEVVDDSANAVKLKRNRIDVWATDSIAGPYYAKKEGVDIENVMVFRSAMNTLACGLKTSPKDLDALQDALDGMYKDGTVKKIFSKYTKTLNISDSAQFLN